jgi:hypothetical protein
MLPKTKQDEEPDEQRFNRIFSALPTLGSPEYIEHIKHAAAAELPPQVLARAYRQLPHDSAAAKATIGRLLDFEDRHGYLASLQRAARRRISPHDWFDSDELVAETIKEIYLNIGTPRGKGAEFYWYKYLRQRLEDAYRTLNGRFNERRDPERAQPRVDEETSGEVDPVDELDSASPTAWHGNTDPDLTQWLEEFVARELAKISDDRIREVARNLFSAEPSTQQELADRYGVDRSQIMRWREIARGVIYAALQVQNEHPGFDVSWLKSR